MKEFIINKTDKIVASTHNTRNGFRHYVEYQRNGRVIETRSVSYLNRTWESYEYESAIRELLNKMVKNKELTQADANYVLQITAGKAKAELNQRFGTIGTVALMGEVLAGNKKSDKNAWKLRMIKAGLGEGFEVPSDWELLSEEEKERRLNKIIEEMRK